MVSRARVFGSVTVLVACSLFALNLPQPAREDRPQPGYGARTARLEAIPVGTENLRRRESYVPDFMQQQKQGNDEPIRWDPCRPIVFVVNMDNAPENSLVQITRAFRKASDSTGYQFVFGGTTEETSNGEDRRYLPHLYGDQWSPVLITWEPNLRGEDGQEVFGTAQPQAVTRSDGTLAWVTGHIRLNADVLDAWINRETGTDVREQSILLHEIGHILGVGHLDNPYSVMHTYFSGRYSEYTPADLEAFRILASTSCMTDL